MENVPNLLIILTVFTGIVALILLMQGFALVALYRRLSEMSARIESTSGHLARQIESVAGKVDDFVGVLKNTTEKVQALQDNLNVITQVVRERVVAADAFLSEVTDMARFQVAQLQNVLDATTRKIDETIDIVQRTVLTPVMEIQALVRGVRTGLDVLFGRRRMASSRTHEDEEMFI